MWESWHITNRLIYTYLAYSFHLVFLTNLRCPMLPIAKSHTRHLRCFKVMNSQPLWYMAPPCGKALHPWHPASYAVNSSSTVVFFHFLWGPICLAYVQQAVRFAAGSKPEMRQWSGQEIIMPKIWSLMEPKLLRALVRRVVKHSHDQTTCKEKPVQMTSCKENPPREKELVLASKIWVAKNCWSCCLYHHVICMKTLDNKNGLQQLQQSQQLSVLFVHVIPYYFHQLQQKYPVDRTQLIMAARQRRGVLIFRGVNRAWYAPGMAWAVRFDLRSDTVTCKSLGLNLRAGTWMAISPIQWKKTEDKGKWMNILQKFFEKSTWPIPSACWIWGRGNINHNVSCNSIPVPVYSET